MPQSLSKILLHIIFSTKNREDFIRPEIENELYAYMASIGNEYGCHAHKIGGVEKCAYCVQSFQNNYCE